MALMFSIVDVSRGGASADPAEPHRHGLLAMMRKINDEYLIFFRSS